MRHIGQIFQISLFTSLALVLSVESNTHSFSSSINNYSPIIKEISNNLELDCGASGELYVLAEGEGELNYTWIKDHNTVSEESDSILVLSQVTTADAGEYRVVVANQWGRDTSAVITVTVSGVVPTLHINHTNFDVDINDTIECVLTTEYESFAVMWEWRSNDSLGFWRPFLPYEKTDTLRFIARPEWNNCLVRCNVSTTTGETFHSEEIEISVNVRYPLDTTRLNLQVGLDEIWVQLKLPENISRLDSLWVLYDEEEFPEFRGDQGKAFSFKNISGNQFSFRISDLVPGNHYFVSTYISDYRGNIFTLGKDKVQTIALNCSNLNPLTMRAQFISSTKIEIEVSNYRDLPAEEEIDTSLGQAYVDSVAIWYNVSGYYNHPDVNFPGVKKLSLHDMKKDGDTYIDTIQVMPRINQVAYYFTISYFLHNPDTIPPFVSSSRTLAYAESMVGIAQNELNYGFVNEQYSDTLSLDDTTEYNVNWTLIEAPQGLSLDRSTGILSWLPEYISVGTYRIRIAVSNGFFADTATFELHIFDQHNPLLVSLDLPASFKEDSLYKIALPTADENGQKITWMLETGPVGAQISNDTLIWHAVAEGPDSVLVKMLAVGEQETVSLASFVSVESLQTKVKGGYRTPLKSSVLIKNKSNNISIIAFIPPGSVGTVPAYLKVFALNGKVLLSKKIHQSGVYTIPFRDLRMADNAAVLIFKSSDSYIKKTFVLP